DQDNPELGDGAVGVSYERRCVNNDNPAIWRGDSRGGPLTDWVVWVPPGDPSTWGEYSWASLGLDRPVVRTSPPAGTETLVNFDTWAWVEGGIAPAERFISSGPLTVRMWAEPETVEIDWGDGNVTDCPGGGSPDDPCLHRYARASESYTITARVTWRGGFQVIGVGGENFALNTQEGSTTLRVTEAQAVVIR
ncbi:MAG: hypothetical protein ACR2JF_11820, partial [Iamia sp.]